MDNTCVLIVNCREPLFPRAQGNVSPIQIGVVKKLRQSGYRVSGTRVVSSLHPNLLDRAGKSFKPYIFIGDISLVEVLDVKADTESGILGQYNALFVRIHVPVSIPIEDEVTGWIALHRLIPGPDYALLRERFPQLPLWENWPR